LFPPEKFGLSERNHSGALRLPEALSSPGDITIYLDRLLEIFAASDPPPSAEQRADLGKVLFKFNTHVIGVFKSCVAKANTMGQIPAKPLQLNYAFLVLFKFASSGDYSLLASRQADMESLAAELACVGKCTDCKGYHPAPCAKKGDAKKADKENAAPNTWRFGRDRDRGRRSSTYYRPRDDGHHYRYRDERSPPRKRWRSPSRSRSRSPQKSKNSSSKRTDKVGK
jgi:hypothetical protein